MIVDQNGCFGSRRDCTVTDACGNRFVGKYDELGKGLYCYVLKEPDFQDMWKSGRCGSKRCPFFKQRRIDIRKD